MVLFMSNDVFHEESSFVDTLLTEEWGTMVHERAMLASQSSACGGFENDGIHAPNHGHHVEGGGPFRRHREVGRCS